MKFELPIFPGLKGEPKWLNLAVNDLSFDLPGYSVARSGYKVGIALKNSNQGLSEDDFFNVVGNSELCKLASVDIVKIEYDQERMVGKADIQFYLPNPLT